LGLGVNFYLVNTDKYLNELLPACRAFIEQADRLPLKSILREAIAIAGDSQPNRPGFVDFPAAVYEEFEHILDGEQYYSRNGNARRYEGEKTSDADSQFFVKSILAPTLLALVCVESTEGLTPWQNMNRPEWMEYLYAHSQWIEDRLTFATEFQGEQPEIVIGEWSRFLSRDDVRVLDKELSGMPPPPTANVGSDYENLRALCRVATTGEHARILACIL